jgi:hypothetical protein
MTKPETRQRLPWGSVLTSVVLAGIVVAFYRGKSTEATDGHLPWTAIWAAAGIGCAVFLVMRWWQNYAWGIIAGLAVPLHPLYMENARSFPRGLVAEMLLLCVLTGTVAAWRLVFLPRFAWRSWLAGGVMLGVATTLAWPLAPLVGLVAGGLICLGLLGASILGIRFQRGRASPAPAWGNIAAAALLGLIVPPGSLLLAPLVVRHFDALHHPGQAADADAFDYWQEVMSAPLEGYQVRGFAPADLQRWAWPDTWVVLPLMAWGWWCTFRRGWKQSSRRKSPLAWVLTLFVVLTLTGMCFRPANGDEVCLLSLASLAALLTVFGIADVTRSFMERLVLAPPQEREE